MRFNWSKFTKDNYKNYINGNFRVGDYVGTVHIGDIGIDLINYDANVLAYDFYVAHEDTGYGYKNDILPYDYADGGIIDTSDKLSYEGFRDKTEKLFVKYIENYNGNNYSLVEHANRPLEIW